MVGIVSNSAALFAQRNLAVASSTSESSIARLSSGNAIVSAADDVAGLAIGTVLRTTVSTLKTILSSTAQATSLLGIADAGLQNIGEILQRQKSLAVQANTGSLSNNERAFLDQEFQSLVSEIDRIVTNTKFNGIALLDGSIGGSAVGITTSTASPTFTVAGTYGSDDVDANGTTTTVSSITINSNTANSPLAGETTDIEVSAAAIDGNNAVSISLVLNGELYTNAAVNFTALTNNNEFVLTNVAGGGTITVILSGEPDSVMSQANATIFADQLENALDGLTVFQSRILTAGDVDPATGSLLDGIDGADFQVSSISADIDTLAFGTFSVQHEEAGVSDGQISVTINGNTYRTVLGQFDGNGADIANSAVDFGGGVGVIRLYREGDGVAYANEYFDIDLTDLNASTIAMDTEDDGTALEDALNTLFNGGTGLTFQVGTTASDSISLTLGGSATTDIYLNDAGTYTALTVGDSTSAQTASDVLDNAINTVTSLRATIGALQSRFNFAASSVNASIQNTEAARAIFLDVDIADESTKFATAQVRLQASISVLAQANLIPQNLLKLIG